MAVDEYINLSRIQFVMVVPVQIQLILLIARQPHVVSCYLLYRATMLQKLLVFHEVSLGFSIVIHSIRGRVDKRPGSLHIVHIGSKCCAP